MTMPTLLHHGERKRPPCRSPEDPKLIRAVTRHVERRIGPVAWVFHDLLSDLVHLDLLWVPPGPGRAFHAIVTCGMSQRPMAPPEHARDCRHAELVLRLPADWPLAPHKPLAPSVLWPLHELEAVGRMCHVYDTWLWEGHAIGNGYPPEPLPGTTRFHGSILTALDWAPRDFEYLQVDRGRRVRFHSLVLIDAAELALAREAGAETLLDRIDEAGISDLVRLDRASLAGGGGSGTGRT